MSQWTALKWNGDFRALYHRGKSQVHPALITYALRQNARRHPRRGPGMKDKPVVRLPGDTRIGITSGKKVGGAVQRNRSRRVIREAYRSLLPRVNAGWDIVFVARTRTSVVKSHQLGRIMEKQLAALGVLTGTPQQKREDPQKTIGKKDTAFRESSQ